MRKAAEFRRLRVAYVGFFLCGAGSLLLAFLGPGSPLVLPLALVLSIAGITAIGVSILRLRHPIVLLLSALTLLAAGGALTAGTASPWWILALSAYGVITSVISGWWLGRRLRNVLVWSSTPYTTRRQGNRRDVRSV